MTSEYFFRRDFFFLYLGSMCRKLFKIWLICFLTPSNAYPGNGVHAIGNLRYKVEVLPCHYEVAWKTNTRTFPYLLQKCILVSGHVVKIRLSSNLQMKPCFTLVVSNKIEIWFSKTLCVLMNIHSKWVSSSSKGPLCCL